MIKKKVELLKNEDTYLYGVLVAKTLLYTTDLELTEDSLRLITGLDKGTVNGIFKNYYDEMSVAATIRYEREKVVEENHQYKMEMLHKLLQSELSTAVIADVLELEESTVLAEKKSLQIKKLK